MRVISFAFVLVCFAFVLFCWFNFNSDSGYCFDYQRKGDVFCLALFLVLPDASSLQGSTVVCLFVSSDRVVGMSGCAANLPVELAERDVDVCLPVTHAMTPIATLACRYINGGEWLFDITQDPNERHDLSAENPAVVKQLMDRFVPQIKLSSCCTFGFGWLF
jgi:hypothetical protein